MQSQLVATRSVPLLDLHALHASMRHEILREMARVVDAQQFVMGSDVKELEKSIATYTGARHAIGCASGSDALLLALMALGVGPGDKVVTTPFTFFATVGAVSRLGATPIFCDIDPQTFNIDAGAVTRVLAAHPDVKAVIPVHLFGACADMDPILDAAREHGCAVIEDGAQSIGAEYKDRNAQALGTVGCISFFPSKNLGAFGDGGMLVTDDEALAKKLAALRVHGSVKKYHHDLVGINSRLDTLQAAVLRVKLHSLDEATAGRQKNAELYSELLANVANIALPRAATYQTRHVYNQYVIRCERRDALKAHLSERGVGSEIYYPLPMHLQPCFAALNHHVGDFPESERAAAEVLAIPIHSAMSREDVEYVAGVIREFYA